MSLTADGPVNVHKGEYSTDLVRDKSLAYLDDALESTKPFFLGIAPIASHSWIDSTTRADPSNPNAKLIMNIPSPHPRHANLFASEQIPRTVSFNPDTPQGVSWVRTLPKLNSTQEAYLDEFYRGRLRVLQAVDELVEQVVQRLTKAGQLDNTYIFYTCTHSLFGTDYKPTMDTLWVPTADSRVRHWGSRRTYMFPLLCEVLALPPARSTPCLPMG